MILPRNIEGMAIMTDTDNYRSYAIVNYPDICFSSD